jgi:hypothetical protein
MADRDVLRAIERRDPDGDEFRTTPPTEADHAAHRAWAIANFGEDAWRTYRAGGWDEGLRDWE